MSVSTPDIRKVTNWTKFRVLFWKNWQIQRRRNCETIAIVLIVLVSAGFTSLFGLLFKPERINEEKFPSQTIDRLPPISILYSPKNDIYENLISTVIESLQADEFEGISNARNLQKKLLSEDKWFAGVEFPDNTADIEELPKKFDVSLRFPPILRKFEGNQIWATHEKFEPVHPMIYIEEGFVQLQNALFMAYLQSKSAKADFPTSLEMQRYPTPQGIQNYTTGLWGLVFLIAYVYPGYCIISAVGEERENLTKEIMKLLGVSNWLHWVAWFLKSFILLAIISVILVILLKVPGTIPNTSWSFLMTLLLLFSAVLIFFCFAATVIFNTTGGHIFYTLAYISMFLMSSFKLGLPGEVIMCILPYMALYNIVHFISELEKKNKGLKWSHLISNWPRTHIKVWQVVLMMILSSFFFMVLCLYFEQINTGEYGIGKKWYFPFQRRFWADLFSSKKTRSQLPLTNRMNIAKQSSSEEGSDKYRSSPLILDENIPGLKIIKLHKKFHDFVAIKEITLDMYVGEITVLLGKNGAGKTTTIFMLTGMIAPTSGTAIVNGYDIRTDPEASRQSLGICPQINSIFNNLTVADHIEFFSRLRGFWHKRDISLQIDKYLDIMELGHKSFTKAKDLSGGMKRKLCLCCALTGNVQTVLCDEPSSGLDPSARRNLWKLLQSEKHGRTILLTTHFMDEADALGDRIAILNDGEIRCIGTAFDLKKQYGKGYSLICDMLPECDKDNVTKFLRGTLPSITLESERGTELTYRLPLDDKKNYPNLCRQLENNLQKLRLTGFGISMTSMEDVFLRVTLNAELNKKSLLFSDEPNNIQVFDESLLEHKRSRIIFQRLKGCFMKRLLETKRQWFFFLILMLLPILSLLASIGANEAISVPRVLPSLKIDVTKYDSAFTVLEKENPVKRQDNMEVEIAEEYEKYSKSFGSSYKFKSTEGKPFEDYILGVMAEDDFDDKEYLVAATIGPTKLIAWINSEVTHAAPLSLNYLHNAMARVFVDKSAEIIITNHPLPFRKGVKVTGIDMSTLDIMIVLVLSLLLSGFVVYPLQDRISGMKLQQMLSGINIFIYWLTILVWDFLTYLLVVIGMLLLVIIFKIETSAKMIVYSLLIFALFGLAVLLLIYILSQMFKRVGSAVGYTLAFNFILVFIALVIAAILFTLQSIRNDSSIPAYVQIFRLIPHVSVWFGLLHLRKSDALKKTCDSLKPEDPCNLLKDCCDLPNVLGLNETAMGWDLIFLFITTVLSFLFLMLTESHIISYICRSTRVKTPKNKPEEDVLKEKKSIRLLARSKIEEIPLVVDRLSKHYKRMCAVHELSFTVNHNECFGLLGVNGAGKTSTFKMLTGEEFITSGTAYLEGYDIRTILKKPTLRVGYCPQENAVIENLTARENFKIVCLWKGMKSNHITALSNVLAQAFGFTDQMKKRAKHLSGGNKRKLCTAVSLIGNPKIIYLDEPSSGMDPLARHQMWEVLISLRETGKPIVLTSHSMEECEALCTRLGIMVEGQFQCLGSSQYLKNKFSKGVILKIKMSKNLIKDPKASTSDASGSSIEEKRDSEQAEVPPIVKVKQFVADQFPNAKLTEEYQGMLTYHIPMDSVNLSELFYVMQDKSSKLNIEDYTITQTTLDEVFLEFAKTEDF